VEVGAVWSDPAGEGRVHGGRFAVDPQTGDIVAVAKMRAAPATPEPAKPVPAWMQPAAIVPEIGAKH